MNLPDLPLGYKKLMDTAVLLLMRQVEKIMYICAEFCGESVELEGEKFNVSITTRKVKKCKGQT